MEAINFLIEDTGDGWWHCPSPLHATVIDGPAPKFAPREDARFEETYWLVEVDPQIEWRGDSSYAERWGPDHPLCHPIEPTQLALVIASSPWSGAVDYRRGDGAVYPVVNSARTVAEAEIVGELGIKAGLVAP